VAAAGLGRGPWDPAARPVEVVGAAARRVGPDPPPPAGGAVVLPAPAVATRRAADELRHAVLAAVARPATLPEGGRSGRAMNLTLVYPSVGRKEDTPYVRAWQMEPLSMALLASLTPPGVEGRFSDHRVEEGPFDEPAHPLAI